jgi:peptidoglycan/LPS O-acetylase OafA/YrhL
MQRPDTAGGYYRPELDVLRFFAFVMVFLSHVVPGDEAFFGQLHVPRAAADLIIGMAAGGAFGVDLFFALSSFLITTLLLRERSECGAIDVPSFYVRRILRIWPLYFVFLFIAIPLLRYAMPDEHMPVKYIVAFALLSGNWACAAWGYPHSVASPLWSVSIEEQFYLSWPLIMRRWIRHLTAAAFVLLALAFIVRVCLVYNGAEHPQIWCNTLARLDPIAWGALLAVFVERREVVLPPWKRSALLLSGVAVLTAAGLFGDFVGTRALIMYPAVAVACTALILGALNLPVAGRPAVRGLVYLGRISYGLYVFHSIFIRMFDVTSAHDPGTRGARTALALLSTVATAAVSYHLLETPFLRLKQAFTQVQSRPV